jgi:hypothetical protein
MSGGGASVAKKEASVVRVSGGAAGIWESTYACRVFGGMVVTRVCKASGVGGSAGFEVEGSEEVIVIRAAELSPLYAASDGEGVRSCCGTEPTAITSDSGLDGSAVGCCCLREKNENIASCDGEKVRKR